MGGVGRDCDAGRRLDLHRHDQVPIQLELSAHGRSRELLERLIETNFWYRRIPYAACAVLFLWMAAQVMGAGRDESVPEGCAVAPSPGGRQAVLRRRLLCRLIADGPSKYPLSSPSEWSPWGGHHSSNVHSPWQRRLSASQ